MDANGNPGSGSAYSKASRDMFGGKIDIPGPAEYAVNYGTNKALSERIAPFDNTGKQTVDPKAGEGPGPAAYYAQKIDLHQPGALVFRWGPRFRDKIDFSNNTMEEPFWPRIPDHFVMMTGKIKAMDSKKPRRSFDKYVSNGSRTVTHPQDVRCYVKGMDGRFYPWLINRNTYPSPACYNTSGIYTGNSRKPSEINFSHSAERKTSFGQGGAGSGPAAYFADKPRRRDFLGGCFLGKSSKNPKSSAPRLLEQIHKEAAKHPCGGPASTYVKNNLCCSNKGVSAPFKSKTPLGASQPKPGPGPAAHFISEMEEFDLCIPLSPGINTFPPDKPAFGTSEPRFPVKTPPDVKRINLQDPMTYWQCCCNCEPDPGEHTLLSFTDIMLRDIKRHAPKKKNPNLGFLSSAQARPILKEKGEINIVSLEGQGVNGECPCVCDKPRKWRNLRPKPIKDKPYGGFKGGPPKLPDSPGPIYDTNPGSLATKAKKTWFDPRNKKKTKTGFMNSGCGRQPKFYHLDMDIPGPGKYYAELPKCQRYQGCRNVGPRFQNDEEKLILESPGPVHKLHEKCSSMWRASHLGTFNTYLKQVGRFRPSAGGFLKKNLNAAGDSAWNIKRDDDYEEATCLKTFDAALNARSKFLEGGRRNVKRTVSCPCP